MKFLTGTKIRASLNPQSSSMGVEIINPVLQRRVILSKKDAIRLLVHIGFEASEEASAIESALTKLEICNSSLADELIDGFNHWLERNWESSLHYYLWSRKFSFIDDGDDYQLVQLQTLEEDFLDASLPFPSIKSLEGDYLRLQEPEPFGNDTVGEVLFRRSSFDGEFRKGSLLQGQFSGMLWYGFRSIRNNREHDILTNLRDILARSHGCALDIFIVIYDVQGIESGVYFYDPVEHGLSCVRQGILRDQMVNILIGHRGPMSASCTICLVAEFERYQWRYRHERALRNLYIDTGHAMQSLILVATAYRLLTHITPAVRDSQALDLLGLAPSTHQVLHTLTLGLGGRRDDF